MKQKLPEWVWVAKEKSYMKFRKLLDGCHTTLLMTTEIFRTSDWNQFPPVHTYFHQYHQRWKEECGIPVIPVFCRCMCNLSFFPWIWSYFSFRISDEQIWGWFLLLVNLNSLASVYFVTSKEPILWKFEYPNSNHHTYFLYLWECVTLI